MELVAFKSAMQHPHLSATTTWIQDFLCTENIALGRKGPVCPYTGPAISADSLFLSVDLRDAADISSLTPLINDMRVEFAKLVVSKDPLKCLLVVFPNLRPAYYNAIDEAQRTHKSEYVEKGLMLGQFHPHNNEPGLWSPMFRPLRSPIAMLAVRHMSLTDIAFLHGNPAWRQSYLATLGERGERAIRDWDAKFNLKTNAL